MMPEQEEIKILRPIAKINNFIRGDKDLQDIIDMKWILNDTFLLILTKDYQIVFFDVLL